MFLETARALVLGTGRARQSLERCNRFEPLVDNDVR